MATSGVDVLTTSGLAIVKKGLNICGAVDVDQPLEPVDLNTGLSVLNNLIKFYQTQTLHLWKQTEGVLFLDVGKTDYLIGPSGDECCKFDDFVESSLSAGAAATDVILSVTDTTGMVANDNFGVRLDTNVRFWTTILSVDSSTQVTVNDALPSDAASGASVYTFTNLISRPLRILNDARFRDGPGSEQIPIVRWARQQYFQQVDKDSQGTVVNDYYSPQLTDGRYYVWQTASDSNNIVFFTSQAPIEVFVDTADEPDFPSEAFLPLSYALAEAVMLEYKVAAENMQIISSLSERYLADWLGFDEEDDSINLQVDMTSG